jgi:two-component system sensor histidine kinase YesM
MDNGKGLSDDEINFVSRIMQSDDESKNAAGSLRNIYKRMKLFFGNGFDMKISSKKGMFTAITFIMPEKPVFVFPDIKGETL